MAVTRIEIEGLNELVRSFKNTEDHGLRSALALANQNAAEIVVDAALPDVPFKSGALRRSVQATATARSGKAVAGARTVPYAAAIHWGRKIGWVGWGNTGHQIRGASKTTRRAYQRKIAAREGRGGGHYGPNPIVGRPFLWRAAQRVVPNIEGEYCDEVLRILDEAVRSRSG